MPSTGGPLLHDPVPDAPPMEHGALAGADGQTSASKREQVGMRSNGHGEAFMKRVKHARVLMYSHDTFGLGHLRRSRTIAHALVERYKGLSVIIISGSPIAGAFDFRARVDFVKVPSVIKLYNGDYTSIDEHIDLRQTLALRRAIIQHTAMLFRPDIFIVDKEPIGLRGELSTTLPLLKDMGTTLVLGLRDVLDSPEQVKTEWSKRNLVKKVDHLYDQIWVYGPEEFWNPLTGVALSHAMRERMRYTGFLMREAPKTLPAIQRLEVKNYILVTGGGGGDGDELMHLTLAAYEHDRSLELPLVLVLGPFMTTEARQAIRRRAKRLKNVTVIDFHSRMEALIKGAAGVVSMCGYNTFCEILSFNKRALVVPRTEPRQEQLIRAQRAAELGHIEFLDPVRAREPKIMANALAQLPRQRVPAKLKTRPWLQGLEAISDLVEADLRSRRKPALQLA
jgi:predicted glycosyltransferase